MPFQPKKTRNKVESSYRSIYISDELREKVNAVAKKYDTSFNNIVISMIEYCLNDLDADLSKEEE